MRWTLALAALATFAPGCSGPSKDADDDDDTVETDTDADTAPTGFSVSWTADLEDDERGMFMSVWGTADDDVWIVGGREPTGVVLRGHGGSWSEVPLPPDTPMLTWVTGTGPDDVWVVGLSGTLLRWDGQAWEDHSVDIEEAFWGAYALSETEAVAVGGMFRATGEDPIAYRWDGAAWTALTLPAELGDITNLFKVHHDGTRFVVVGAAGTSMTVDGTTTAMAETGVTTDLVTVHRSEGGELVAVGGRATGTIHTWDGTRWNLAFETISGLSGVHELADGAALCVGDRGYAGVYDRDADMFSEYRAFTQDLLHATWVSPGGDAYAVGGNFFTAGDFFGVVMFSDATP